MYKNLPRTRNFSLNPSSTVVHRSIHPSINLVLALSLLPAAILARLCAECAALFFLDSPDGVLRFQTRFLAQKRGRSEDAIEKTSSDPQKKSRCSILILSPIFLENIQTWVGSSSQSLF